MSDIRISAKLASRIGAFLDNVSQWNIVELAKPQKRLMQVIGEAQKLSMDWEEAMDK